MCQFRKNQTHFHKDWTIICFQVVKPVNVDALSKWVGKIPEDVVAEMDSVAPMLRKLGYDPHANPPNYGKNF